MSEPLKLGAADPQCLKSLVSTKMPFGKYKGRMIAELPSAYLSWFMRQGMPKGRVGLLLMTRTATCTNIKPS